MSRIQWIDYARGIAIFGVVMWHTVGGVVNSGVPTTEGMAVFGDLWDMYTFRLMPIFFFISGAFFAKSLLKPFQNVFSGKFRTIVYPYFVWSLITLVIGTLTIGIRNGSETLADLPRLFYDPILHFWFLYALFIIMLLSWVGHKLGLNKWVMSAIALVMFVLSASTLFYNVWYVVGQIGYFAIYFVAGSAVGSDFLTRVKDASTPLHLSMLMTGSLLLVLLPIGTNIEIALLLQPLASTIAMIMCINLAVLLSRMSLPFVSTIAYWGRLSLEIYLIHVLALSTVRIVMYNVLGIENAWLHIVVGIACGMYVPIVIKWVSDKLNMNILFVAPAIQLKQVNKPQIVTDERVTS